MCRGILGAGVLCMALGLPVWAHDAGSERSLAASQPGPVARPVPRESAGDMASAALRAVIGVLFVVGGGLVIVVVARRRGHVAAAAPNRLRTVSQLRLGPRSSVHLIEVDGRAVLLVCGDDVNVLPLDQGGAGEAGARP